MVDVNKLEKYGAELRKLMKINRMVIRVAVLTSVFACIFILLTIMTISIVFFPLSVILLVCSSINLIIAKKINIRVNEIHEEVVKQ